jgi:hypothetical protein
MSYTLSSAIAHCSIAGIDSTESAALAVYDYLVNHPDEIPEALDEYDSDEVVTIIQSYLTCDSGQLTISYSTESDSNSNSEVFDFLSSHFASLQTSLFMEVAWATYNSRDGRITSNEEYYDRSGEPIDIKAVLSAHLT